MRQKQSLRLLMPSPKCRWKTSSKLSRTMCGLIYINIFVIQVFLKARGLHTNVVFSSTSTRSSSTLMHRQYPVPRYRGFPREEHFGEKKLKKNKITKNPWCFFCARKQQIWLLNDNISSTSGGIAPWPLWGALPGPHRPPGPQARFPWNSWFLQENACVLKELTSLPLFTRF